MNDSPRVPAITSRSQLPAPHRVHFDAIAESRGSVRGPFGVLLNSPPLAHRVGDLGAFIRFESEVPGAVRELSILVTARAWDCAYIWAAHEPQARAASVPETTIEVVADEGPTDALSTTHATVVRYNRELLTKNEIRESTFQAAVDDLAVTGVIELTATIGYYSLLACVCNAVQVTPDDSSASF